MLHIFMHLAFPSLLRHIHHTNTISQKHASVLEHSFHTTLPASVTGLARTAFEKKIYKIPTNQTRVSLLPLVLSHFSAL